MADNLARAQLARAARQLNRGAGLGLPPLVLLTDDERLPDPIAAVLALPPGSLVVLRSRDKGRRMALATSLTRLARARGLEWIVADDAPLAANAGAQGAHFPEHQIALAARWRVSRPQWLITCAAHSLRACARAAAAGADAVLLSPVFPTASHPDRPHFGSFRLRLIARAAPLPVYALGGVDEQSARRLAGSQLAGLAAIKALSVGRCVPAATTV
ncbi:MAG: thiamine phosphate synthase [Rhizomicrobium sp.]